MYSVKLMVGHNVGGRPFWDEFVIMECAESLIPSLRSGCTVYEARGRWEGESESTTVIEVCGLSRAAVESMRLKVPALCESLMQDAIGFEYRESVVEFVGRESYEMEEAI